MSKPRGGYVDLFLLPVPRNQINRKMMSDPEMTKNMNQPMPFDMKRMLYGGFKTIVSM